MQIKDKEDFQILTEAPSVEYNGKEYRCKICKLFYSVDLTRVLDHINNQK
jgi:hypothetical protein